MHSKNMSRAFPISGRILWMVSFIILSILGPRQATTGSRVRRVPEWCSAMHCEDCARSEVFVCSNGAASNRSGDLCGCCRSCVQIRDFGASCGSQLAVRFAPDNFGNWRSRFTVLATASCRPGLVCINFTCERSEDEVDRVGAAPVERKGEGTEAKSENSENDGSEELDDLRTNVITVENSHEFYYRRPDYDNVDNPPLDIDDAFTIRETDPARPTSIPWPISLTTEMLPTTGREVSESIESRRPDNYLDSSGHLVNVIMSGREFQLIHGREALADLKLLLQSVDKTQSPSILDEFEALLLYEHFKDVLELVNSGSKSSSPKEVIDPETGVSTTVDPQEHFENENRSVVETVRDSGGLGVLRKFASSRNSKLPRPRIPLRFPSKFRRKRQLEDSENEDPRSEYSEVVIYDFLNDTPRTMMDPSRRWFIAREVETTSEQRSPTARLSDPDVLESTINIHITGIPRTTNSASEFELVEEERTNDDARTAATSQDYDKYDDNLEIFVSDANTEFPNFSEADGTLEESANLTTSPVSQSYERFESQSGEVENATGNDWQTSTPIGENSGYFGTNYEFTFPESPVIMDDDYALALRVNETVDEFRTQLNRIETKVVVIESSLYNMMTKLGTNERSPVNEGLEYTIESDNFPYSGSTATGRRRDGRRILLPRKGVTNFPEKKSTYAYVGPSSRSGNGRSFKVEDEGVAQLIPIRSNRRWRTVSWQPAQVEAPKVFGSRGLYPSRSGLEKVREEVDLLPSRKKSTLRRASHSGRQDLIARRTGARKVSREGPTRSPGKIQSQTFLSDIDTRSSTRPADIVSREQYSLRVTPLRSPQQAFRSLNPARSRLSTERTKRRSSEVDSRGRDSKIEETPVAQESVATLETQIPKPLLRAREFKDFDNGMGVSPTRLATIPMEGSLRRSFDEEDNWNWSSWDDGPSFNLFAVNGEQSGSSSEFGGEVSSRSRESPTIVLPMENENPGIPEESWETVYPSYLDYSERLRRDEETENEDGSIKAEATQSSTNLRGARRISAEGAKRMKRAADFYKAGQFSEPIGSRPRKRSTERQPTIQNRSSAGQRVKCGVQMPDWVRTAQEYDEPLLQVRISEEGGNRMKRAADFFKRMKRAADFSQASQFSEAIVSRPRKESTERQSPIQNRSSSGQRAKRGVQMADWLRAAQEYHERLQQVRTAALGTWLASREELDDTNLTDVKLFTREIPTYLERYRPSSAEEEDSIPNVVASQVHPMEVEDPPDDPSSIPDEDELFIEFLRNQSASLRNDWKNDTRNDKNGRDPSGETSSSTARKFTIIATGNSTIRIEELPESGDEIEESLLKDQSAQGSISMDRRTALAIGESEDFDHMYEGVDAEDGDFDYGDPNFALSRWLDEVDIIDASSVEIPVDKAESTTGDAPKDEEDYEVDELLSRSKRDMPLFLFRVNGDPGQEVLVWPSNWKDFIDRHFRRNRTGNPPQRTTKRTRTRISKLKPARTGVSEAANKNSHERDDEVSSSAERTSDEGAEKKSSMELAFARRFQDSFENHPRQKKRKNVYPSNIGNYK